MNLILTALEQGFIFAVLAIGVYITYKILDFPDLSAESTYPLGAFIFAKFVTVGLDPITSTLCCFIFGSLAGLITYFLHIKLRIKAILSGILTMTLLYSVNLRISGKSNVGLFNSPSIFDGVSTLIVLAIIVIVVKTLMDLFFKTEVGYLLIATGDNETLVKSLGQNCNKYKLIGLMISNGLVALSGGLMAQSQGFADITMGTSIIVIALASIIIGDTILKNHTKIKGTTRVIIGAILYKIIGAIAIDCGLEATDLRAVNALIVIAFISYNTFIPTLTLKRKEVVKKC